MKVTEAQIRKIVRSAINEQGNFDGAFAYKNKAKNLRKALTILQMVQQDEVRLAFEEDPDLAEIINQLDGLISAVDAMDM